TMALAGEKRAIDIFKAYDAGAGIDPYCWFGGFLYGKAINKKDNPKERQISKSAFLGCGFGAGPTGLQRYSNSQSIKLSLEEAEKAVKVYRSSFKGVPNLWYMLERILSVMYIGGKHFFPETKPIFQTGYDPILEVPSITLLGGLRVKYPGLRQIENLRHADTGRVTWAYGVNGNEIILWGGLVLENLVQATARYILQEMLLKINPHIRIVMQTHDELVGLVKEEKAEIAVKIMKKIMTTPLKWWPELPLNTEVSIAKRYGDAK
ncbi:MAG: hypothetical protein ACREQ5_11840, partial [Candidatus Dormibacteria bacterium]